MQPIIQFTVNVVGIWFHANNNESLFMMIGISSDHNTRTTDIRCGSFVDGDFQSLLLLSIHNFVKKWIFFFF